MITNLTNLPVGFSPNYLLTISWVDGNNNMFRYAMWKDIGEVIFENIPLYAGQKIGKNFRFEVWSTDLATIGQATSLQFTTSKLQSLDYRWGVDTTLVNSDPEVTQFSVSMNYGNILVSGAGTNSVNGLYIINGTFNGRNQYVNGINYLRYTGLFSGWVLGFGADYYSSSSNVATPDLATGWTANTGVINPVPTVTNVGATLPITWPVPSQPILNP